MLTPKSDNLLTRTLKKLVPKAIKDKIKEGRIRKKLAAGTLKPEIPEELNIQVTDICNAKCTFCAYTYVKTPMEIMDFDIFKKTIDQYAAMGGQGINFTPLVGDALVDPGLIKKIDYIRNNTSIRNIGFATNAILLHKNELYKKLIDSGVTWLQISSPGFDDAAYKRVYQTSMYPQIMEGIKKMLEYKKKTGSKMEIFVLLRIDRTYEEIIQDAGYKELLPYINEGLIKIDKDHEFYLEMDSWCNQIKQEDLTGLMRIKKADKTKPRIPCYRMISNVSVLPKGDVRVCSCRFYKKERDDMVVGDITKEPLSAVIDGKNWQAMLSNIVEEGKWPKACSECTYYSPMKTTD